MRQHTICTVYVQRKKKKGRKGEMKGGREEERDILNKSHENT